MLSDFIKATISGPLPFRIFSFILFILVVGWIYWGTKIANTQQGSPKENKPKVSIQDSKLKNSPVIVDSPGTKVSIQEEKLQRTISPEASKIIADNLKSVSPLMIEIRAVAGDQESIGLSKQIKTIFEKAGWNVNWAMQFFTEKINSFVVVASEDPGKEFRKAITPLFSELGYDPVMNRDDAMPAGTVWIQVGPNQ